MSAVLLCRTSERETLGQAIKSLVTGIGAKTREYILGTCRAVHMEVDSLVPGAAPYSTVLLSPNQFAWGGPATERTGGTMTWLRK